MAKSENGQLLVTQVVAAELLGCSLANVKRLLQESKLERASDGRVDVRSLCAILRKKSATEESAGQDLKREQARYRKLKADLADIELKLASGQALATDEVVAQFGRGMTTLRESLEEIEQRLPEQCQGLNPRQIAALLDDEFTRLTNEFFNIMSGPLPEDWREKYKSVAEVHPNDADK